jgi:hypothetical protein
MFDSVPVNDVIESSTSGANGRSLLLGFEVIEVVANPLAGFADGFFFSC